MTTTTIPLEQHSAETSKWKETVDSLSKEVEYLKEQVEWFKRQIFGQKAEKYIRRPAIFANAMLAVVLFLLLGFLS